MVNNWVDCELTKKTAQQYPYFSTLETEKEGHTSEDKMLHVHGYIAKNRGRSL